MINYLKEKPIEKIKTENPFLFAVMQAGAKKLKS